MLDHLQDRLPENIPIELNTLIVHYKDLLRSFIAFVDEGMPLDSSCPCNSGLTFDKCHAITMDEKIRQDKNDLAKLGY